MFYNKVFYIVQKMDKYKKNVDILIQACLDDLFPTDVDCLKMFMFDCVSSMEDATNLLGMYIGLVKLHPDFDKDDFIQAIANGHLKIYLIRMNSTKYQSYYTEWFMKNHARFSQ